MYGERDLAVLEHIVHHCERIERIIVRLDHSYENLMRDPDLFDAISMNILQIGELSGHLSDVSRETTKDKVPWRQVKDMRNRFAHGYWTMSSQEIFNTASVDIPTLKDLCKEFISGAKEQK